MTDSHDFSRRRFVQSAAALLATGPLLASGKRLSAANDADPDPVDLNGRIFKTLKIGMVAVKGSLSEKFQAVKDAGFDGIEMDSPGMNVDEAKQAMAKTGLPIDGTVCSTHWSIRHTSPNADERAKALDDLKTALRDTHAVGGNTVLLVVGHGKDGPENEIWQRSVENISQALPLAAQLGVYIAIENVWNQFLYDHDGGADQTADKFVKYVDEFNSPWVGMQFDIGNHWKYGSMGDWIRALGKRVVKLDVKGFSRKTGQFTKISEGDIDWLDVCRALGEIGYNGWAAAEVSGGGPDRLREISANMDKVFSLTT